MIEKVDTECNQKKYFGREKNDEISDHKEEPKNVLCV